jgi:hypothetical protein
MHISLEQRLVVTSYLEQGFQHARRIRMKAHDLARSGAVLEVNPTTCLKPAQSASS